jgi:type I restriction enzyme S subunit
MRPDWQVTPLGKFIKQSKKKVKVQDGFEYPAVGVMMEGRGFVTRPPFVGGVTTYKQLTPIEPNQLVLRSITAWEAPIQVTTQAQLGFHVSGVFPVFDIDSSILNPRFLSLWCRYEPFWESMRERTVGSVLRRKTLSATALMEIPIQLPPLPEQKRIVDLISSVDSYIEALQQQLESAKRSRNAVLHELLTAGGDDWVESSLGVQMSLEYGKPLTESNRDGIGFPVYGSAGIVGMHSEPLVTTAPVIIVGRKGTAGAVYWSEEQCFVIDTAYFVALKTDIELKFLYHLLNFVDLKSVTAQTGVPGLNRDRAYSLKCKIPPKSKQFEIVEIISTMDEVVNKTESILAETQNLRSGLLSDLLSGEHEIPPSYDKVIGTAW